MRVAHLLHPFFLQILARDYRTCGTICITRDKALPSRDSFQIREDTWMQLRICVMCLLCIPCSDRSHGIQPGSRHCNSLCAFSFTVFLRSKTITGTGAERLITVTGFRRYKPHPHQISPEKLRSRAPVRP